MDCLLGQYAFLFLDSQFLQDSERRGLRNPENFISMSEFYLYS